MPPRSGNPATRARQSRPKKPAPAGTLTFKGATYKLDSKMGIWPLLQFARAAESGLTTVDAKGLAAIHAFLQDVIDPEDWGRFQEDMISKKVDDIAELMNAAQQAANKLMDAQGNGEAKVEIVSSTTDKA